MPPREALAGAIDAGQRFLRGPACRPHPWGVDAYVAVAARRTRFAEIAEEEHAAAACRLGQPTSASSFPYETRLNVSSAPIRDHAPLWTTSPSPVRHPRVRGQPVAPRPTCLLVIRLDTFRQVEVRDDRKSGCLCPCESDRRDDHHAIFVDRSAPGSSRGSDGPGPRGTAAKNALGVSHSAVSSTSG